MNKKKFSEEYEENFEKLRIDNSEDQEMCEIISGGYRERIGVASA